MLPAWEAIHFCNFYFLNKTLRHRSKGVDPIENFSCGVSTVDNLYENTEWCLPLCGKMTFEPFARLEVPLIAEQEMFHLERLPILGLVWLCSAPARQCFSCLRLRKNRGCDTRLLYSTGWYVYYQHVYVTDTTTAPTTPATSFPASFPHGFYEVYHTRNFSGGHGSLHAPLIPR